MSWALPKDMLELRRPIEEEEEEEETVEFASKQSCPACQETLLYTDEVFLLEVCESSIEGRKICTQPVQDEEGDYVYPPYFLHLECWEEVLEEIREATEDALPMASPTGILLCDQCESTIGSLEPFIASTFAEIHVSQRRPNGERAEKVEKLGRLNRTCLACAVHIVEEHFSDWEDLFENLPHDEEEEP